MISESTLLNTGAVLLLVGLGVGALTDLRTREVPEALWVVLTAGGAVIGGVAALPYGGMAVGYWILAALFVFQHLVPWDTAVGGDARADWIELGIYGGVLALFGLGVALRGVGESGVPVASLAVLVSVLFARALFEAGVLFGGADAKAVMVAALLVPLYPDPWFSVPAGILPLTAVLPFAVDLLLDAALLSIIVPLGLAVVNIARGEFRWRDGFTTYSIPVTVLADRFVWVRDSRYPVDREAEGDLETSEADRQWRERIAAELVQRGIARIRVGPQLPFIVLLAAGALAALAVGNLVFDLLVLL